MTKEETAKILAYFRELYPQGDSPTKATVNAWFDLIHEYDYRIAWEAAKNVARTWEFGFMPPPGILLEQIRLIIVPESTDIELWRIAEKAIRRGTVFTKEEFNQLPEELQIYFGGVSAIRDLALSEIEQVSFERARFLKQIPNIRSRVRAQAALPAEVKQMLAGIVKSIE